MLLGTLGGMTDLSQILADRLTALRPRDAVTGRPIAVHAWASQLGIDRKKLERVLKNEHESQLDTLEHIADRLGLNPLELVAAQNEGGATPIGYEAELRLLSQLTEGERGEVRGYINKILADRVAAAPAKRPPANGTNGRP